MRNISSAIVAFLTAIAGISILGSLLYYAAPVATAGLIGVVGIVIVAGVVMWRPSPSLEKEGGRGETREGRARSLIAFAIGVIGLLAWFSAVAGATVTESVRSPWLVLDPKAIIALAVVAVCASMLLLKKHVALGAVLLASLVFAITSMAASMYPLGYGFDPFLHRATVSHIIETGTITPKPLYYIGQYTLELVAVKLFALPLFAVDAYLVPVLLALAVFAVVTMRRDASVECLLFIPFSAFIPTTPQALAYVFVFLAIWTTGWRSWLFGVAAMMTHPLAGIPIMLFLVIRGALNERERYPNVMTTVAVIATILGAVAVPAVFLIQSAMSGLALSWATNPFDLSRLPISGYFANGFSTWLDALYLVGANLFLITLVLAIVGFITSKRTPATVALLLTIIALIVNFIVLNQLFDFTFLISYERSDFASRLLTLISLFSLPLIARLSPPRHTTLSFILIALLAAGNVYAAYPRHDGYTRSAGFNVSPTDIDAVHAIARRETSNDYVVLANQAVSAAAVNEFGFVTYFPGDIFYYPIPTGGPLYDVFLSMVDDAPTKQHAQNAMNLTGASTVYLVVNDYWWQSDKIIATAKAEASDWFALGDGAVTVFIYEQE